MILGSLDIPWGGEAGVAGAFMEVREGRAQGPIRVTAVAAGQCAEAPGFPADDPEVAGFIANGVGPGRARANEAGNGVFPCTPQARDAYLRMIWNAFCRIAVELQLTAVDLLLADVPLVPAGICATIAGTRRPVETAFENKVWIPGRDGSIQFPRLQGGIIAGCRPGYAICALAELAFNAPTVGESFPQLSLGSLQEMAEGLGIARIARLAGHKNGNRAAMAAGQTVLDVQLKAWLGDIGIAWMVNNPPPGLKADGYDALLGLLPLIARAGILPPSPAPWRRCIQLRNHCLPHPPMPVPQGAGHPCTRCESWKSPPTTTPPAGTMDDGIWALDMRLWGP